MPSADEEFENGFHGLPNSKQRSRMSPERLAILLSEQRIGTPAYILVEHELNLRIAKVQSSATLLASFVGIVGVVVGILLTGWLQPMRQEHLLATQVNSVTNADSNAKQRPDSDLSAATSIAMPNAKPGNPIAEPKAPNARK